MTSLLKWAVSKKKQQTNRGGSGYEISRDFKEKAGGTSRGYLKITWNL